jgi:hypothetical protein
MVHGVRGIVALFWFAFCASAVTFQERLLDLDAKSPQVKVFRRMRAQ